MPKTVKRGRHNERAPTGGFDLADDRLEKFLFWTSGQRDISQ